MTHSRFTMSALTKAVTLGLLLSTPAIAFAQQESATTPTDSEIEKIEVKGSLGSLPGQSARRSGPPPGQCPGPP